MQHSYIIELLFLAFSIFTNLMKVIFTTTNDDDDIIVTPIVTSFYPLTRYWYFTIFFPHYLPRRTD